MKKCSLDIFLDFIPFLCSIISWTSFFRFLWPDIVSTVFKLIKPVNKYFPLLLVTLTRSRASQYAHTPHGIAHSFMARSCKPHWLWEQQRREEERERGASRAQRWEPFIRLEWLPEKTERETVRGRKPASWFYPVLFSVADLWNTIDRETKRAMVKTLWKVRGNNLFSFPQRATDCALPKGPWSCCCLLIIRSCLFWRVRHSSSVTDLNGPECFLFYFYFYYYYSQWSCKTLHLLKSKREKKWWKERWTEGGEIQ